MAVDYLTAMKLKVSSMTRYASLKLTNEVSKISLKEKEGKKKNEMKCKTAIGQPLCIRDVYQYSDLRHKPRYMRPRAAFKFRYIPNYNFFFTRSQEEKHAVFHIYFFFYYILDILIYLK